MKMKRWLGKLIKNKKKSMKFNGRLKLNNYYFTKIDRYILNIYYYKHRFICFLCSEFEKNKIN